MPRRWVVERRRDFYYRKAKELNYRSRAAFKLKQIDQRFRILRRGATVVDLGAAPGGWLQVAKESVGSEGIVVGVDLQPILPIEGVTTIRGDIRSEKTVEKVLSVIGGRADVVLSDMSPNISGNYSTDHARSVELCEHALEFAKKSLKDGGSMVVKIFQGDLLKDYLRRVRKSFLDVKLHSPKASRPTSSEIYVIARGFVRNDKKEEDVDNSINQ
ncbi:MAG: RlmE family RNA methyltransferase [Methanomassiliicoccales archaeon]|jgi:23S rRNA methylase|nr:RlmE family RNA methyltransferase [Methanomassiliicoccales archaeon]